MTIEISALDTLFFKDGKPFSMGEDTWATGIFPPPPSVFYGMLRTNFAAQNKLNADEIEEKTKRLKITSIFLKLDDICILPYPADLFSTKELSERNKAQTLVLKPNSAISNIDSEEYPNILKTETNKKIKEYFGKAFISQQTFKEYLSGEKENQFLSLDEYLTSESKIGIGKDLQTNMTSEGKLYRVGMKRLESFDFERNISTKLKFLIEFENLEIDKTGFLKFGAENKVASYINVDDVKNDFSIKTEYLKIYLATPAIFENGSLPKFMIERKCNDVEFELLTYAIGKPVYIGGFDMKKGKPKPMKKAAPAGSVFYLKTNKAKELAELLHGKSISEQQAEQGFGICYCGTYNT